MYKLLIHKKKLKLSLESPNDAIPQFADSWSVKIDSPFTDPLVIWAIM